MLIVMLKYVLVLVMGCLALAGMAREPRRGYRGFVYWENAVGAMYYFDNSEGRTKYDMGVWMTGVSTVHGYQFNRHVYAGAGLMIAGATSVPEMMIPLFADFRYDYGERRFMPFGDVRIGGYYEMLYFSPTVGFKLVTRYRGNLNVGAGLTLQTKYDGTRDTSAFFTLRIGVDF